MIFKDASSVLNFKDGLLIFDFSPANPGNKIQSTERPRNLPLTDQSCPLWILFPEIALVYQNFDEFLNDWGILNFGKTKTSKNELGESR